MKRLVLMTVLVIAVLGGLHVGPSLAQVDQPPVLEVSINGESGRSVRDDVGNLVVFWWTAPSTGSVTFDTEGSTLDTLLWVQLYNFDDSGTVIFNDDAENGTYQSAVRFTAIRGLRYAIAIGDHSDWERTGTIVLNWQLESLGCDGPTPPVAGLGGATLRGTVLDNYDRLDSHAPAVYILAGQNASTVYWLRKSPSPHNYLVTSSLYIAMDGSESVHTYYDGNGYPHKVVDECSGNWMRLHNYGGYGGDVDFWFYDTDDKPLNGLALFEWEGQYHYGVIPNEPIHAGKYTTGESKTTAGIAHYELYVEPPDVTNVRPVPAEIAALMDSLSQDSTKSTGLSFPGSRSSLAAILRPLGAFLPGVAHAAIPGGGDLLQTGGALVAGIGLLGGIVGGAVSAPLLIAGGAVYMAGHALNIIHDEANERLGNGENDGDMLGLSVDHLTAGMGQGLSGFLRDVKDWVVHKNANVRDKIDRGKQALRSLIFEANPPDLISQLDYQDVMWLKGRLAPNPPDRKYERPSEVVTGSWTIDGTTVSLGGTISTMGAFQAADSSGDIVLTGTWSGDDPHEITHNQRPKGDSPVRVGDGNRDRRNNNQVDPYGLNSRDDGNRSDCPYWGTSEERYCTLSR